MGLEGFEHVMWMNQKDPCGSIFYMRYGLVLWFTHTKIGMGHRALTELLHRKVAREKTHK